jgi:hypothetical protein
MNITNKRGNVNSNKFIQIEPTPTPSDALTNIFPIIPGQTDQYINEITDIDLNSATLENYAYGTTFRVRAEVTNTCGDKAINAISFKMSPKPTIGDVQITCTSTP